MRTLLIPLAVAILFIVSCCDASSTMDSAVPPVAIIDMVPPAAEEDAGTDMMDAAGDAEVDDADIVDASDSD